MNVPEPETSAGAGICQLPHRNQPDQPRRAINGTRTCPGCRADLKRALAGEDRFNNGHRTRTPGLPELWAELETILPAAARQGLERGSGSRESKLPFAPLVSVHRALIRDQLCSWAAYHAELRGETGPHNADPDTVARWLALSLDWAVKQDWIADYADELRSLRRRARSLLDPVRRSTFAVEWCIEEGCPGALVADIIYEEDYLLPSLIYCDNPECGREWPPHRWMELGRVTRRRKREQNGDAA